MSSSSLSGVSVVGPIPPAYKGILTKDALAFLAQLHRNFNKRRLDLLGARVVRSLDIDAGNFPTFNKDTQWIREGEWKAASIPADLADRRVEITGPVDRKMIINALNSGAKVFMADFEDATSPTWDNLISGQQNLKDAIARTISFTQGTKEYKLKAVTATLMVRPRGWHLEEGHLLVDGERVSGSLFDFGLFFFHNAVTLCRQGSGPYFYLPKMESHLEARLWNDVFVFAQQRIGLAVGTIRATVLIETILAAFEMDEIIYELRQHSAGLNCGRWDYIFSYIKKFKNHPKFVLPDRAHVGMTSPFMANYVRLLIQTCHRRGVHAMGGMAALIPVSGNAAANAAVFEKVKSDKLREVLAGCDGTWVAHPGLIGVATAVFDEHMKSSNQISKEIEKVTITPNQLLDLTGVTGGVSLPGVRGNLDVSLDYIESWIRGLGCVPLHNLMEDAATAEIARCQIWQWIKNSTRTVEGVVIDKVLIDSEIKQLLSSKTKTAAKGNRYELAEKLLRELVFSTTLHEFLTSLAYPYILTVQTKANL